MITSRIERRLASLGRNRSKTFSLIIGTVIVFAGLQEIFPSVNWDNVWPYFAVAFGLLIITAALFPDEEPTLPEPTKV